MMYTRYFLLSATLPLALFLVLGFYLQPLTGDLTRLGKLSERDFGWNAPQPVIRVTSMSAPAQPDVVVLGDSFSEGRVWQSVAARQTGLEFITYHWHSVGGHACLDAWVSAVKKAHPSIRFIVLQTVERMFVNRFVENDPPCSLGKMDAIIKGESPAVARQTWSGIELPDAVYAVRAAWNALRSFEQVTRSSSVYIAPLVRQDLFSNRRSGLLLFYKDDLDKTTWRSSDLNLAAGHIRKLQIASRAKGVEVVLAVVPDKSTAYASYVKYPIFQAPPPDVWKVLDEQHVDQIDVKGALLPRVTSVKDLYLPDNTHVGTAGYSIIGHAVAQWLER